MTIVSSRDRAGGNSLPCGRSTHSSRKCPVSDAAGIYAIRLFKLPGFLTGDRNQEAHADEVAAGLALTGHFLLEWVLRPHGKELPPARSRLDTIVISESE